MKCFVLGFLFLYCLMVSGGQNLLSDPALTIKTAGNATVARLADGALEVSFSAGTGWPQIQVTALPAPNGANSLRLDIRLPESIGNTGISLKGYPADTLNGRYFNSELKAGETRSVSFSILSDVLSSFRLSAKNPEVPFKLVIEGIYYDRASSLADGYGFESPADMGKWHASGGARFSLSREYAFRGKQSLKLEWDTAQTAIVFSPAITDWRPYKQLRFTLFNPLPVPNKKYRLLLVNRKYLPGTCSIAGGQLTVQPESIREFILDLDSLPETVDRGNIRELHFFKGSPETVFYLDSMKLYTAEEVEALSVGRIRGEIESAAAMLSESNPPRGSSLETRLAAAKESMRMSGTLPATPAENEKLTRRIVAAKELASLALSAPDSRESLVLRGVPALEKVFRDIPVRGEASPFRLAAAGNERESFQVVALPLNDLKGVEVSAGPLKSADGSEIPATNIAINPVGYVEVEESFSYNSSRPGFWPDVLVHNQKLDLSGRLQPYWITVQVPAGCKEGLYKGEIRFAAEGGVSASYPYEIQVFDFSLPERGKLLTFFDWRYTPADPAVRRKCYDAMLDHRLSPTSMYINGQSPGSKGGYQYSPHPDDIEHCMKRGMNVLNIWYLYDGLGENPHEFDEKYLAKVKKFIDYYRPILEKKEAWEIAMINGFDEIMHQSKETVVGRLAEARKICAWLKKDYPGLRICNVGRKMDISTDLMDVWFMGVEPKENIRDVSENGGKVCFYWVYGNPSPMLDLPGAACRILSWQAFKEGAEGIGYYSTYRPWALDCPSATAPDGVDWPKERINIASASSRTSPNFRRGRNGDGNLFYPDRDGSVLASTRLANIRDGIEDYEYLAILKELDPAHPLLRIPDEIVAFGDDRYTKDFKTIEAYRRRTAEAIVKAMKNRSNEP
jgi:hypothetical protein